MKKFNLAFGLIVLLIAVFAVTTYSTLIFDETFVAGARVRTGNANLGIYSDSRCTKTLSSINWGNLTAGQTKTFTVYVKNTGNTKIILNMTTSNWSSYAASQVIMVGWSPQKTALTQRQTTKATIKLTVPQSVDSDIETFSFNIIITGKA